MIKIFGSFEIYLQIYQVQVLYILRGEKKNEKNGSIVYTELMSKNG